MDRQTVYRQTGRQRAMGIQTDGQAGTDSVQTSKQADRHRQGATRIQTETNRDRQHTDRQVDRDGDKQGRQKLTERETDVYIKVLFTERKQQSQENFNTLPTKFSRMPVDHYVSLFARLKSKHTKNALFAYF